MKPFLADRVARHLCIARCERGQTEGPRAWGSSELKASGEMDGEYAAHWASADHKSGVSSSMGRSGSDDLLWPHEISGGAD